MRTGVGLAAVEEGRLGFQEKLNVLIECTFQAGRILVLTFNPHVNCIVR